MYLFWRNVDRCYIVEYYIAMKKTKLLPKTYDTYKDKGIFIPPNKDGWWVSAEIMCTM
jgi:hypothetical protein